MTSTYLSGYAAGLGAAEAAVAAIHYPVREGRLTLCEGCMENSGGEYSTAYPCATVDAIADAIIAFRDKT